MNLVFAAFSTATLLATAAVAQITIPPHYAVYNGYTRGFNFTSSISFLITGLDLPVDAFQAGDTANYLIRINGANALYSTGNTGAITTSILVNPGDVVDVLGNWSPAVPGNFTAHNSYGSPTAGGGAGPYATTILGVPHTLNRTGWQWDIGDPNYTSGTYLAPVAGQLGRVLVYATPATGIFANFTANVHSGPSPLTVQFTDQTYTDQPGGVTGWAWDFGDGGTSNLQNPSHQYTTCGSFDVTLTAVDGVNPPSIVTKNSFIVTDQLTANFTSQVVGPFAVIFTDTSNMPASSWAWDLDGDSVVDSTAQNPGFAYPNANPVQVTLTVTRNCQTSTVTKTIVPTQQLSTNLVANNNVGTPATLYYNLDVLNPAGIQIGSFDSITTNVSTAFTVDWYVKIGTYSGFELNPAPWTAVGQASGTSNPVASSPSNAAFAQPLYLPAGSYGIAMRFVGITPGYVTLAALTNYANGDVSLTAGSASLSTAGPFTGTNLNTPRGWSGTLYYSTYNITGSAGAGFFGPGCAGSLGVSHQTIVTNPQLGGALSVDVSNMPLGFGLMILGTSNTLSGGVIPLPADLAAIGAPGCPLRVSADVLLTFAGAGTTVNWSFPVPNSATLSGLQFYNQAAVVDLGANALGLVTSDAIGWIVGN